MAKGKRYRPGDKRSIRNLVQYRDMTDEEFDELFAKMVMDVAPVSEFEDRIEQKLLEFEEDYDLSDMKVNDKAILRGLCQNLLTLEDYEQAMYRLRMEGISDSNLTLIGKYHTFMSDLRRDISSQQDDLKITRKIRKGDREESVINFIEDQKQKAREFYESKMAYILCPECNMLLGTVWSLYPEDDKNKITYICHRKLESGRECGTKVTVNTKELLEKRMVNVTGILPESMT